MRGSSRRLLASSVLATGLVACSGTGHPTAPTSPSPAVAGGTLGVAALSASAVTLPWPCIQTPGSAPQTFGCPSSFERHVMRAAAASAGALSAPTNLTAVVSGSTVTLSWLAPSGSPSDYILQAGSAAGLSNLAYADLGSAATSVTVTNVPSGTYFVRVAAANSGGQSGSSNEIVVTVGAGTGPCSSAPAAPTGLTETVSGSTVTLAWGGSSGATSYVIQAGSVPGLSDLANMNTGNAASSIAVGAPPGTYYVRVAAVNACGTSAASKESVVVVGSQTLTFADAFNPPSVLWSNSLGHWTATNGQYYAQQPNNSPGASTLLPFVLTDYTMNVTINAIGDEGIYVRSNTSGSINLILGGQNYGQGSRGGQAGSSIYFFVGGAPVNTVNNALIPGNNYAVKVTAVGNTYSLYLNGSSTPVDTYTDTSGVFSTGGVGFYDDQPNTTTGSGFGPPTTFSNLSLQGTLVGGTPTFLAIVSAAKR